MSKLWKQTMIKPCFWCLPPLHEERSKCVAVIRPPQGHGASLTRFEAVRESRGPLYCCPSSAVRCRSSRSSVLAGGPRRPPSVPSFYRKALAAFTASFCLFLCLGPPQTVRARAFTPFPFSSFSNVTPVQQQWGQDAFLVSRVNQSSAWVPVTSLVKG